MTVSVDQLAEQTLRRLGIAIVPVADRSATSTIISQALLATHALQELGVIASDETPMALDQQIALEKVGAVQDSLSAQGIAFWPPNEVPFAISEEITKMTAIQVSTTFGKQGSLDAYKALEARVRNYSMIQKAPAVAVDAVMGVHQELDAMGLVRWTVFDIPDSAGSAYVMRAAASLAPYFGQQPNSKEEADGLKMMARYTALPSSGAPTPVVYF